MENQGVGVDSYDDCHFQTVEDIERFLLSPDEIDPSFNHDQNQDINDELPQRELNDASNRKVGRWSTEEDRFYSFNSLNSII